MRLHNFDTFLFDTLPEIHRTSDETTSQKQITRNIIKTRNGFGYTETETKNKGQLWRFLYPLNISLNETYILYNNFLSTYDLRVTTPDDLNFWLGVWWLYYPELCEPYSELQSGIEISFPAIWSDRDKRIILKDLLLRYEYLGSLASIEWYVNTILGYSEDNIKYIHYWDHIFYLNVEKCRCTRLTKKICVGDINTFTNPEQHLIKSSTCTPIPYGEGGYGEFNYGGNCDNGEWEIQHVVANGGGDEGYFTDILVDGDNIYIVSIINDTLDRMRLSISNDGGDTWSYYLYGAWSTYFDTGINGVWLGKRLSIEKKDNTLWIMRTNFADFNTNIQISAFDLITNQWDEWDGLDMPNSLPYWEGFWHDMKIFNGKIYTAYIGITPPAYGHGIVFARSGELVDYETTPTWEIQDTVLSGSLGWDNWGIAIDVIANSVSNSVFIIAPATDGVEIFSSTDDGANFTSVIYDSGSNYVSGSVAAKDEDNVVISYYDSANSRLRFGKSIDGGANFVMSTITTGITDYVAMRVKDDNIRVVFYDGSAGDLKLAESNDLGVSWNIVTIDSIDDVGTHTSIQYVNDIIYISYRDESNGSLKFSKYVVAEEGGVELLQLDHNFLVNFPPSLFITDSSDNLIPEEDYIVDWLNGTVQFINLSYIGETFNFYYCYNHNLYIDANYIKHGDYPTHTDAASYLVDNDMIQLDYIPYRYGLFKITDNSNNDIPDTDYIVNYETGLIEFVNGYNGVYVLCYYFHKYDDEVLRHLIQENYLEEDTLAPSNIFKSDKEFRHRNKEFIFFQTELTSLLPIYQERNIYLENYYLVNTLVNLKNMLTYDYYQSDIVYRLLPIHYGFGHNYLENHWKINISSNNDSTYDKKLAVLNKEETYGGILDWVPLHITNYEINKIN